jgi:flagellin
MSVINTNVSSLIAQNALAKNQQAESTSLERLSTGLQINSGADNPSGLIEVEGLKSEQAGITQAISNANTANDIIGTAEGGLSEVNSLLTQVQSLVSESANTGGESSDETAANQLQVDSILDTINKIAGSTTFDGKQLLNGNLDYTTSGAATSAFGSVQINTAQLADNSTMRVSVKVVNSATTGQVAYTGTVAGAHAYIGASAVTLQIAGSIGTQAVSVAGSSTISSVATAINQLSSQTGVSATTSAGHIYLSANQYGSANFVSVQATSGTFNVVGGTNGKATGKDAVVTVNGATTTTAGTSVSYHTGTLDVNLSLTTAMNKGQTKVFTITGGGATFQLDGQVEEGGKASIGIQSVNTASLGSAATGYLASLGTGGANSLSSGNFTKAQSILTSAVNQVSDLRGRLGAFQTYTLGSTIDNLNVASENAASAESAIEDTDFASETANLTRDQILTSAAQTVLSQANSRPQAVLSLLQNA